MRLPNAAGLRATDFEALRKFRVLAAATKQAMVSMDGSMNLYILNRYNIIDKTSFRETVMIGYLENAAIHHRV
jgi:hypothetical protein